MIARIRDNLYKISNLTINLYNKYYFKKHFQKNKFPKYIGLMVSRVCGGGCIFCSIWRYKSEKKPFMSLKIAKKVANELIERNYKGPINFGENGDALLNPEFKGIFKEMKKVEGGYPILFTNMKEMNEDMSNFLLRNGLREITFNLDGASKLTYESAKTLCKYEDIVSNVKKFIKIRNEVNPECKIHIKAIPPKRYIEYVEKRKTDLPYDFPKLKKQWSKLLNKGDTITEGRYFGRWGTKDFNSKKRTIPCPIVGQVNNCYIDTEGNIYPCCVDYKTLKIFGNIMEKSIYDIWNGDKRREFFTNLVNKDFDKIGPPCINCGEKNDYIRSYLNYLKYKVRHTFLLKVKTTENLT